MQSNFLLISGRPLFSGPVYSMNPLIVYGDRGRVLGKRRTRRRWQRPKESTHLSFSLIYQVVLRRSTVDDALYGDCSKIPELPSVSSILILRSISTFYFVSWKIKSVDIVNSGVLLLDILDHLMWI